VNWTIHFYCERVREGLVSWPSGIYADFLRLARKRVKEVKREN
jgi:hypothetical protein